jgi:hypothetical protein
MPRIGFALLQNGCLFHCCKVVVFFTVEIVQHTKPWQEPVFVPFQNGGFFVEADAVSVHSAAGLERICMTMVSYGYFGDLLRLSERQVLKIYF